MKDFTIDKLSWYVSANSDLSLRDKATDRLRALAQFLDANSLSVRTLLPSDSLINDDFAIVASSLTSEGLELMKRAHDKWLKGFSRNPQKSPIDVSILTKELQKLRG